MIGYASARLATIVVLANSIIAPDTLLVQGLPADRMAATIQQALFPVVAAQP